MKTLQWPYSLPIWQSFYRAVSPDGQRVAQIDFAFAGKHGNEGVLAFCCQRLPKRSDVRQKGGWVC
jgi:hypothetical protein